MNGSFDEFLESTRLIRRWLAYETVATDALAAELQKWADYWRGTAGPATGDAQ